MKIFKYPLRVTALQRLELPEGAQILSVKVQNNEPMLYALVNPDKPKCNVYIISYPTGQELLDDNENNHKYIDTFSLDDDGKEFVSHVFERLN